MRIRIPVGGATSGGVLDPIDPPPPPDINDFFELAIFAASRTSFEPFAEIEITWKIVSRDPGILLDNFVFTLVDTYGLLADEIDLEGTHTFTPHRNTLVRVRGRRIGGSAPTTLGSGIALAVDENNCRRIEIPQEFVDAQVTERLSHMTSENSQIRLRRRVIGSFPNIETVEAEPESDWRPGRIRYDFPLEIVINNFFNANLDVTLEIRFSVEHSAEQSTLDVSITHDSDVDFSTAEDILSLGSSTQIASGIEDFLPLVMDCQTREMERQTLRAILDNASVRSALRDGLRLLAVRVVELGNFNHLAVVLCPPPSEPESPGRPDAPDRGGVVFT